MPLVKEDLRQIEALVEELLAKKSGAGGFHNEESQRASVSSFSDREIFERILNVELELKYQRDLIEKVLHQMDKRFEELREDMNRRFEQVDKRFEQVDKRFEQVDKRFEQVDKRFEQVDKRFEELREDMNRRFEQVDKRSEELREDMNKRFSQLFWFIGLFIPLSNSLLFLALSYVLK